MTTIMDQSDIALPDLTETQHIGANSVEHSHENGDQVIMTMIVKPTVDIRGMPL